MNGDFALARELIREADAILDDLGRLESAVSHHEAIVELLAGDPGAAESKLLTGYQKLSAMGERSLLATTAALLAVAASAQGRDEDAEEYCRVSERSHRSRRPHRAGQVAGRTGSNPRRARRVRCGRAVGT